MTANHPQPDAALAVVNEAIELWGRLAALRRREVEALDRAYLASDIFGDDGDWEFLVNVSAIPRVVGPPITDFELDRRLQAVDAERAPALAAMEQLFPDLCHFSQSWPVQSDDFPAYLARQAAARKGATVEMPDDVRQKWRAAGYEAEIEQGWAHLLRRGVGAGEEYDELHGMLTRLSTRIALACAAARRSPVQLRGPGEPPLVWDEAVDPLGEPEYELIRAIETSWPVDRSGPDLTSDTGIQSPGKVLARLAKKPLRRQNPKGRKWGDALRLPGKARRGGYSFLPRP